MRGLAKYLRWEIFKKGFYRRPGFELRPTDTVLDIGGNIGVFVLWAAPQVPRGRVVTVEPNPAALEFLRLNVQENGLRNVTVVEAAAGQDGTVTEIVYHPGYEAFAYDAALGTPWFYSGSLPARAFRWMTARLTREAALSPSIRVAVPTISIGRIMDEQELAVVNHLKLDCEGSEFEILRGIAPDEWLRIECVAMEYHLGRGRKLSELVRLFRANDFDLDRSQPLFDRAFGAIAGIGGIWARRSKQSNEPTPAASPRVTAESG
jgi:FkbM family methyltransferase